MSLSDFAGGVAAGILLFVFLGFVFGTLHLSAVLDSLYPNLSSYAWSTLEIFLALGSIAVLFLGGDSD